LTSDFRYSLLDNINGKFTIVPNSGRIATQVALNREEVSEYTLKVVAMDTSLLPLSATTTVRVVVDDKNDNPPVFGQQSYAKTIPLPASAGS